MWLRGATDLRATRLRLRPGSIRLDSIQLFFTAKCLILSPWLKLIGSPRRVVEAVLLEVGGQSSATRVVESVSLEVGGEVFGHVARAVVAEQLRPVFDSDPPKAGVMIRNSAVWSR